MREPQDDEEVLPPRPRGRLLRPLPLALIAVAIAAAGFLGGVLAQKGSEGGGSAGAPAALGIPSMAAPAGDGGTASGTAMSGTVTGVEGHTIYVKEMDGTVVAVKAGAGATVTRDSNVAARKIHPGDTVVFEGSKNGSTVKASSISATESGVEPSGGVGSGAEGEISVESLFEE